MPLSSLPLQLSPICSSCGMTKPLSHQKQCVEKQTNKQNSRFFRWPLACRWIVCWIPASSEKMETSRLWTVNIIIIRWAVHLNCNSLSPPYPLTDEATQLHCTPWQPVDASTPSCSSDHKKECLRSAEFLLWNFQMYSVGIYHPLWAWIMIQFGRFSFSVSHSADVFSFNNGCSSSTIVCFVITRLLSSSLLPHSVNEISLSLLSRCSTLTARCLEWTVGTNSKPNLRGGGNTVRPGTPQPRRAVKTVVQTVLI